ncbi:hypothetical protein A1D22_06390 [Pasteurellaceae bacterium LFhippo2]|nr:hypothetical protein [Pasteurellaceae bacterium LFhippo2]
MSSYIINKLSDLELLAESEEIEFKLAQGKDGREELPKDFWKSYSAMANAHGGWIILGVREKSGKFTVAGVDDVEKIKIDLFNLLNNRDHVSANLLAAPDSIEIHRIDSSLSAYRNRLSANKPDHPYLDLSLFDFFQKIGGWGRDRISGTSGMTIAGLLMFGEFNSIISLFPHYFIDYREPSEERWSERIYPDGTWSGNLFDFYRKTVLKLAENLRVPFVLEGDQRIDDTPVHKALRETLVNTLVHADYSERTSVLVEKYSHKFEFRNPGNLRLSQAEIFAGDVHDCRNGLLHQMFLLIGLGERAGSGMPKIMKGCESANWALPQLIEKLDSPQYTTLVISTANLIPETIRDSLNIVLEYEFDKLTQLEQIILATIWDKKEIDHSRCCELTSQHSRDVTLALQKLMKKGFLESKGTSRQKIYLIPTSISSKLHSVSDPVKKLLKLLEKSDKGTNELMKELNISHRNYFKKQYLQPAISALLIEMTIPDKPSSRNQKYRITELGQQILQV